MEPCGEEPFSDFFDRPPGGVDNWEEWTEITEPDSDAAEEEEESVFEALKSFNIDRFNRLKPKPRLRLRSKPKLRPRLRFRHRPKPRLRLISFIFVKFQRNF